MDIERKIAVTQVKSSTSTILVPDLVLRHLGAQNSPTFVFAHGAGAGMDSDFMLSVGEKLADQGVHVIHFEFDYMRIRRALGSRRPPDRMPKLILCFQHVLKELKGNIVIGGKSMGSRVASMIAAQSNELDVNIKGVVSFGYPFHPANKPDSLRTEHFDTLSVPMLILQGERDKLGDKARVAQLELTDKITINWLPDGDHDLKPRVKSGYTHAQNIDFAVAKTAKFIQTATA